MSGSVRILPIAYIQTWTKARNFHNWSWPTYYSPVANNALLPFYYSEVRPLTTLTVSNFQVRDIEIAGDTKTVGTIKALSTGLLLWVRGSSADEFRYPALARISMTGTVTGLKEYYIKLSDNQEFISEPWYYIGECDEVVAAGDYDLDDYNLTNYYV